MKFSWTTLLIVIFLGYIANSVWTLYQLWNIPKCVEKRSCFKSSLKPDSKYEVHFYQSKYSTIRNSRDLKQIFVWDDFDYTKTQEKNIKVKMLDEAVNNKSVYMYIALIPKDIPQSNDYLSTLLNAYVPKTSGSLTTFMIPEEKSFNLLHGQNEKIKSPRESRPISHWKNKLVFEIVTDTPGLPQSGLPPEIIKFIKLTPKDEYLPVLYLNSMRNRITDLEPLNKTCDEMSLNIVYNPISFGLLRLFVQLDAAMSTMKKLGFSEKDVDEVKGIFTDTNFYLLCGTFIIAAFHLLFDFLAFKNDIAFWRKKQSMVGVSIRSVMWRCISQIIIFLHLLDEETTKLILIPAFMGTLIEVWKVIRAFKIRIYWKFPFPRLEFGSTSDAEKLTSEFDAQIMKYLSYILYPLCIGGAIYSLLYQSHKSCYAWCLQNLVNGVYAFGFIFMLPQLFLNYKLKSVAHLPWRAFMYKAFNTFIDDIFAFIITMPTAHRIACFRDDVVFMFYLYQSWLYPVDKKRVNEYGENYEDEKKEN